MAGIAQRSCLLHDLPPRDFFQKVVQRHGVCHDLKTIIQASVMLTVNVLAFVVGECQQFAGIFRILSTVIDLQLYAEVAGTRTIENRLRLEIVVMDLCVLILGIAAMAVWRIIIVSLITGIILMDHTPAASAGEIVIVIAPLTQGSCAISGILFPPETISAVSANYSSIAQTFRTEELFIKRSQLFQGKGCTAGITKFWFS